MRFQSLLVVLVVSLSLGCGGAPASADAKPAPKPQAPAARTQVELDKASPAERVVLTYLDVHGALAADAAHVVADRYRALAAAAGDKAAIADESIRKRLADAAQAGSVAKDITAARKAFDAASKAMIDWLRATPNPAKQALHLAYCPMAFDTGAKWLQASAKVENPYYGAEMFTCGSIKAKLEPGTKLPPN